MQKYLFWYPWILAALIIGILVCLGMIAYMLFFEAPQAAFYSGAELVKEVVSHASI